MAVFRPPPPALSIALSFADEKLFAIEIQVGTRYRLSVCPVYARVCVCVCVASVWMGG